MAHIRGTEGDDYEGMGAGQLNGTTEDDTIEGLGGNDVIEGGTGGDNLLIGGAGNDNIYLGGGSNTMQFNLGDGDDIIFYATARENADGTVEIIEVPEIRDAGVDTLAFGPGISKSSLIFGSIDEVSGFAEREWMVIQYGTQDDAIAIPGWYWVRDGGDTFVDPNRMSNLRITFYGDDNTYNLVGLPSALRNGTCENDTLDFSSETTDINSSGGAGNDLIKGGSGNDSLHGDVPGNDPNVDHTTIVGDDTVYGGAGDDYIYGGYGDDSLYGEGDKDFLVGGIGNDYLDGGDGDDSLNGGAGEDTIYGGAGNDTIWADAWKDSLTGSDTGKDYVDGGANNDEIHGGYGDDTLYGDYGDDSLFTGEVGNNLLTGGKGNDMFGIEGGSNTLRFELGDGKDAVTYAIPYETDAAGNTVILDNPALTTGVDTLEFGPGIAKSDLKFSRVNLGGAVIKGDSLKVEYGAQGDSFTVNGWHYTLDDGNTYLPTSRLDMQVKFDGDETTYKLADLIAEATGPTIGTSGKDTLGNPAATEALEIYGAEGDDSIMGGSGDDTLFGEYAPAGLAEDGFLSPAGYDPAVTVGNDTIFGGAGDDYIYGGGGDDEIHGGAGIDAVIGDFGNDKLFGDGESDLIVGGDGNDTIYGGADDDEIWGDHYEDSIPGSGSRNDLLYGDAGDDLLYGGYGNDTLYGGDGDDELSTGEEGNNLLIGGKGNDSLWLEGGSNTLRFELGDGQDTVAYGMLYSTDSAGNVTFEDPPALTTGVDTLEFGPGITKADLKFSRKNLGGTVIKGDSLLVEYGARGDSFTVNGWFYTLGDGNTYLPTNRLDMQVKFAGDSNTYKLADLIKEAETPPAPVQTDDGPTELLDIGTLQRFYKELQPGGKKKKGKLFKGASKADRLTGTAKNDTLKGLAGNDKLTGGKGHDRLLGGGGNDKLNGGAGNDYLAGGAGKDVLTGSGGHDWLDGGNADDKLKGGGGNDTLIGGAGKDNLSGGGGKDIFLFNAGLTNANADVITDFKSGEDKIALKQSLFGKLGEGRIRSSNFAANASGAAETDQHFIIYNTTTGALLYDADGAGSGAAVEIATLKNKANISAADIFAVQ